jgi:hypothetical protein
MKRKPVPVHPNLRLNSQQEYYKHHGLTCEWDGLNVDNMTHDELVAFIGFLDLHMMMVMSCDAPPMYFGPRH